MGKTITTLSIAFASLLGLAGCKKHTSNSSSPANYKRALHFAAYGLDKKDDTVANSITSVIDTPRKDSVVTFTPLGSQVQFMLLGYVFVVEKNIADTSQFYSRPGIAPGETVGLTYYRLHDSIYFSDIRNTVTRNGDIVETIYRKTEWSGVIQ